jgi:hypothetical protein
MNINPATRSQSIYTLNCPVSGNIRYVGYSYNPKKRYLAHVARRTECVTHKNYWISSLINKGLKPVLEIWETTVNGDIKFLEQYYISLFKSWGFDLTNSTLGGDGAESIKEETKAKISKTLTGKKQSEETKEKRRQSSLKTWSNPELKEIKRKQSKGLWERGVFSNVKLKGNTNKKTEQERKEISKRLKKYFSNPDSLDKNSKSQGGKSFGIYAVKEIKKGNRWGKGYVVHGELIKQYDCNIKRCANEFNIHSCHISKCLKGNLLTVGGYAFKYL